MNLMQLFSRRPIWKVALYRLQKPEDIFGAMDKTPEQFFGEKGLRLSRDYHSTTADPFLFTHADRLYLFFEVQTDFGKGEIWAESMGANGVWESHGLILAEEFHVSYPNVFSDSSGSIYMLPETAASGSVLLYTADEFPFKWRRVATLLDTPLSDPTILFTEDGMLLLGTNRRDELKIHALSNLDGPASMKSIMVTNDKAISRSAGAPFVANGKLYRPAQNCSNFYGENINLLEVETLGATDYSERLVTSDIYPRRPKWMKLGYHHLSIAKFGDDYFLAVDGRGKDQYANTILLACFKIWELMRRGRVGRQVSNATRSL
jgi:hypothetical protein